MSVINRITVVSLIAAIVMIAYAALTDCLVTLSRNQAIVALNRGLIYWPGENPSSSMGETLSILGQNSDKMAIHPWRIGDALLLTGSEEKALEQWSNASISTEILIQRALHAENQGSTETAIAWLNLARKTEPTSGWTLYYIGVISADHNMEQASRIALEQAQSLADSEQDSTLLLEIAVYRLEKFGKNERPVALNLMLNALTYDQFGSTQEQVEAYYLAAYILTVWGEYRDAHDLAQALLALDPTNYDGTVLMGRVHWKVNDSTEALEQSEAYLRRAIEYEPANPWSHFWLANFYQETGQLEKAAKTFEKVLAIDSDNIEARNFLIEQTGPSE